MYYKVIDDFLPEQNLISLYNSILSDKVKWSFNDSVAFKLDTTGFYFYSVLFELIMQPRKSIYTTTSSDGTITTHDTKSIGPHPDILKEIQIIVNKIQNELNPWAGSLLRVRACLYTKSDNIIEHAFHTDCDIDHVSVIFYLNQSNGYTRLNVDNEIVKIESKQNRLLIMDGELEHASSTCTDNDMRVVINFNFSIN